MGRFAFHYRCLDGTIGPVEIDERLAVLAGGDVENLAEQHVMGAAVMHFRDPAFKGNERIDEALELQNATPFGLTAGLHSLDADEVDAWIDGVEAGNLYVNRGITGAIVRRQPFGGWKRSSVGGSTKATPR